MRWLILLVVFSLLGATPVRAQRMSYGKMPMTGDNGPREPVGVGFDQNLGAAIPSGLVFYDHNAQPVTLETLAAGKPTILCLGYYRCPKLCNQVQGNLLQALKDLRTSDPAFTAGGPFNVVMVSVDPREDAVTYARPKRINYLNDYGVSSETDGWWFLTASAGQNTNVTDADRTIHTLANAVGFNYTLRARRIDYEYNVAEGMWKNPKTEAPLPELPKDYDYNHSSGVIILTPDARVSSYLLGLNFQPKDLRNSLVMASGGGIGTFFERNISPYCMVYDEVKGHYRFTLRVLSWIFAPMMLGVVMMAVLTVRKARREKPLQLPGTEK